uniref:RNA polymerase II subunit B1 CTD phosphatase RPAP2 homolog n=1 Tax=Oryzias latipes TaxID=8090 RepID=A0A3P9IZ79_ORYLA
MATEGKMKNPGKTSRKAGRRSKTLTAEEEATRRKEALREQLELERRALEVVEQLLESSVAEDFLLESAKFITPANYRDAVEERSILKLCGYPTCPKQLGKIPSQQFKISTKTNRVYDITERKRFCSNFCYKASKEFELQIPKTPLWLRKLESPPKIRLLTAGQSGSSGEEVLLSDQRLKEEDVEKPQAAAPAEPCGDHQSSAGDESSGGEQDFVSSVALQQQKPRVHWADRSGESKNRSQGEEGTDGTECLSHLPQEDRRGPHPEPPQLLGPITGKAEPQDSPERPQLEEVTAQMRECTLHETAAAPLPGLHITQVGMSRRGAAGLRALLGRQSCTGAKREPASLLETLSRTLKAWCTDHTIRFLHGAACSPAPPHHNRKEEGELDEDDDTDEVILTDDSGEKKLWGAEGDYETLQRLTQQMELRVKEFYKGTWVIPVEEPSANQQNLKEPVLPLVDSQAQHLIQKRITVEKLSSCLRTIVGPLHLTLSDVSTDLNDLVRTFRFTNTNIVHKSPEWTLIAVVLLHVLSTVSPVVRGALEADSSVDYVKTLLQELGLEEQHLLSLVELFQPPHHTDSRQQADL